MRDDVKKYIYGTLVVFVVGVMIWLGIVFINACGFSLACDQAALQVERTPIPTLIPATMPAPTRYVAVPTATLAPDATATEVPAEPAVNRPSNPGGPGEAVTLTGDAEAGKATFAANCVACHGAEGKGSVANPGSKEGFVPVLNPAPQGLKNADPKIFAENIDLFVQHGSTPAGTNAVFQMPAWGDTGALTQQQIADVIAYIISLNP
jgi:mono/diheme cytochrome c family protein